MLMPSIFGESLFDDWMDFPFRGMPEVDRKLYGKRAGHLMKTDVRDHEDHYEVDIDLPGFKKEEITAKLENGYLTISAAKGVDEDEKDEKSGQYIRRERYAGSMSRTYYVGTGVKQGDIQAKYEDGILKLQIPKVDQKAVDQEKYIQIAG